MAKCSFCSKPAQQSRSFVFVTAAGEVLTFCCKKCKNNWRLKREPSRVKWVNKKIK